MSDEKQLRQMITEVVRAELANAIPVMVQAIYDGAEVRSQRNPRQLSTFDRMLADTVSSIYRDQGRKPVKTLAVATRLGYSRSRMLELLQDAEQGGAVASIPPNGQRHSGLWVPLETAA